ncbi:MAG TPA: FAD-dependent oxidoreductase, partial [Paenalcaligenes sp.]|nr:FAD-dependent oxidoreductase [Paenalcaligenes sp.]
MASAKGVEQVLRPTAAMLQSLNEPNEWLEGPALHEKIGFKHFRAAIYTPGTVLLNPAALTRGLADHLPENVRLFEHSPVVRWNNEFSTDKYPVLVETPSGRVRARKMILAVNVFAGITMRRTTDQRILIRQNIRYEPKLRVSDEALARG